MSIYFCLGGQLYRSANKKTRWEITKHVQANSLHYEIVPFQESSATSWLVSTATLFESYFEVELTDRFIRPRVSVLALVEFCRVSPSRLQPSCALRYNSVYSPGCNVPGGLVISLKVNGRSLT
jgi:hypothetical protein